MSNRFSEIELPSSCESEVRNNTLLVKKWNWDYEKALAFQKQAQAFIQKNRDLKIYIFCNHPHVFTMGRGNERGIEGLVELTNEQRKSIKYPVHKIHRGGGITFHYPGQWIFYPIVAVKESFSLGDLTCWMLKSVRDVLTNELGIQDVITANKLMGVWKNKSKLASIGVGLSKFVTEHGLALNVLNDENMFNELKKINPCGIDPTTYITAESQMSDVDPKDLIEKFHKAFVRTVLI
jgi:lipoyl(octanoyl) transferase